MGERAGRHFGLTVLAPIINDPDRFPPHDTEVRSILDDLPEGPGESPLAKVPGTHFARLLVIDDVVFEGAPTYEDHLQSKYLLFTSNFDGGLDAYLEALLEAVPELVDSLWSHCYGYPGVGDPGAMTAYLKRCRVKTSFLFSDYPEASLGGVLRALMVQREFFDFVGEAQETTPEELKANFEEFMVRMRRTPGPDPGTM